MIPRKIYEEFQGSPNVEVFLFSTIAAFHRFLTESAMHAVLASAVVSFWSHSGLFMSSPTSLNINNVSFISLGQR